MFSVPPLMTATRVLRSALASFARHRRFTVASIATLSLGLAVTTVLFGLVYSILLRPLPFRDADRLVAISQRDRLSAQGLAPVSFPLFQDWLGSRTLDGIAALRRRPATIRRDGISGPVSVGVVSASLFPMLGVETVAGRGFRESEDRPGAAGVVILSQRFWRERFAEDVGAIGESLQIDGHTCLVVGVVSDLGAALLRRAFRPLFMGICARGRFLLGRRTGGQLSPPPVFGQPGQPAKAASPA